MKEEATVAVAVAWRESEARGHHFQESEAASRARPPSLSLSCILESDGGMVEWGFNFEPILIL